ncbi:MAG: protein tyrosine phosphatase family protein [Arcobacter sp.]|nr:protein tyrosine phosphatase family protein [Arcobacter sp.]
MENILNYIKINDFISTSGQPKAEEFELIKKENFEVVINLALSSSSNALKNEDKTLSTLDMSYFHIPVNFENPSKEQLKLFIKLLSSLENKKVWIHCAKNYRVTSFMYVYHKYILKTPFEQINLSLLEKWCPNKNWQNLMKIEFDELFN